MTLIVRVTDPMFDNVPRCYDLHRPQDERDFKAYCRDLGGIGYGGINPGERIVIECVGRY